MNCEIFDPIHCSITWAMTSLKIIIPFIAGWIIGNIQSKQEKKQ